MRTIMYKGYQASVEFDDGSLFVKVLHIDDVLVAECDSASGAEKVAQELIDDYLADCEAEGRAPTKPFKGSFNVRLTPELHKRAAMEAAEEGQTLNSWISNAIQEKVECSRLSERIDGVIAGGRSAMLAQIVEMSSSGWGETYHTQYTSSAKVRVKTRRESESEDYFAAMISTRASQRSRGQFDA